MFNPLRSRTFKRLAIRGTLTATVGGLSWLGYGQVKQMMSGPAPTEPAKLVVPAAAQPKPIPLVASEDPPADPFASRGTSSARTSRTVLHAGDEGTSYAGYGDRYPAANQAQVSEIPPANQLAAPDAAVSSRPAYRLRDESAAPRNNDPFGLRAAPPAQIETVATDQAAQPAPPMTNAAFAEPAPIAPALDANARPISIPSNNAVPIQAPPSQFSVPQQSGVDSGMENFAPPRSQTNITRTGGTGPLDQAPTAGDAIPAAVGSDRYATGVQDPVNEGTGRPGSQQLEGAQSPTLTIEKNAPAEIQVGKPAVFTVRVRNTGNVTAHGVEVHDEVPKGTQLVSTTPQARRDANGLVFDLGTMKPGQESLVEIQLMPVSEGEIGSLATVHFKAEASVRTVATKPELAIEVTAPEKVMIGTEAVLHIKVSNPGTGAASGVVLVERVPQNFRHAAGEELEFEVGSLKPGESKELELGLTAAAAGPVTNVIVARGDSNLRVEAKAPLTVIAPALKVGMSGPKKRFLERNATYTITLSNPGTAAAHQVELVSALPKGLKFVSANNAGQYDAATHSVYWSLEELPPQETGSVTLVAQPLESGEHRIQVKGQARQGLADQYEETISVEGVAAIQFELVDVQDPVEVGGQTTYEIRVTNSGSKAATNLRLVALLPAELKAVSAEGPAPHVVDGQRILFEPLRSLAPKADTSYTIKVQAQQPGDLRLRVQVVADEIRTPITKEESTRVYADE